MRPVDGENLLLSTMNLVIRSESDTGSIIAEEKTLQVTDYAFRKRVDKEWLCSVCATFPTKQSGKCHELRSTDSKDENVVWPNVPLQTNLPVWFGYNFRHSECHRQQPDEPGGFFVCGFRDCLCTL